MLYWMQKIVLLFPDLFCAVRYILRLIFQPDSDPYMHTEEDNEFEKQNSGVKDLQGFSS